MIKYLIVMLSNTSPSFCYYDEKSRTKEAKLMPIKTLKSVIDYAINKNWLINFLYGEEKLPAEYKDAINSVEHINYVPINMNLSEEEKNNSILIINSNDKKALNKLNNNSDNNIIIRLKKNDLGNLNDIVASLIGKFKRLNLLLLYPEKYTKEDIETYKNQLQFINETIIKEYKKGNSIELNFLSDRLLLDGMNNCNAGIDHVTIAPNGKFYICPGFFYNDEKDFIGDLKTGINIKNAQLLDLDHAPICSICDAFQCKRCVWLNKKLTLEINTPSFQQCALSHIERESTRLLLNALHNEKGFNDFNNIPPIPAIDYIDPLQVINNEAKGIKQKKSFNEQNNFIQVKDGERAIDLPKLKQVNPLNDNLNHIEAMSTKDLLIEIYKMQKEILKEFNKK